MAEGVPLVIPEWQIELWDISGSYVLDISRFVSIDLELKLNDADTVQFSIDLKQFTDLCTSVGLTPRNVLYPKKTQVIVRRNGIIKTGGRVSQANTTANDDGSKTLAVTVDGYEAYFAKRFVSNNWVATERSLIAWQAIDMAQSVPNGDLGVVQGTLASPLYASDLTADFMAVKDILQRFTYAQPATYDYEIAVDVVGGEITKTFNTYTRLGSDRPQIELVDPLNFKANVSRSGDSMANRLIGLGSGIGDSRLQSIQEDSTSQLTYLVEEQKQLFNTVSKQETLDENTIGLLENSRNILGLFSGVAYPGAIDLDVVSVGDSLTCRIENDPYNNDVDGLYRIYTLKIQVDENRRETVTPSFYNPNAGGELSDETEES